MSRLMSKVVLTHLNVWLVRTQETLTGTTSVHQAFPSQSPEINKHQNNAMSEFEIKILKTKIIADNNLDGLLSLENRIEPGIDETINTRLERDNLIQEAPANSIDLSHLSVSYQKDFCLSPAKPSQAKA